jgi:hypothetical protein
VSPPPQRSTISCDERDSPILLRVGQLSPTFDENGDLVCGNPNGPPTIGGREERTNSRPELPLFLDLFTEAIAAAVTERTRSPVSAKKSIPSTDLGTKGGWRGNGR